MKKTEMLSYLILGAIIVLMLPADLVATTTDTFGSKDIDAHTSLVKNFIFGAPLKFASCLSAGYGGVQCFLHGSHQPLMTWGGISLALMAVPKFIDGVLGVSGMLLP